MALSLHTRVAVSALASGTVLSRHMAGLGLSGSHSSGALGPERTPPSPHASWGCSGFYLTLENFLIMEGVKLTQGLNSDLIINIQM